MDDPQLGTVIPGPVASLVVHARDHLDLEVAFIGHLEDGACLRIVDGRRGSVTPDAHDGPGFAGMAVTTPLATRSYSEAPIVLDDGELHGTLCGYRYGPGRDLDDRDVDVLRFMASLIASRLTQDRLRQARRAMDREDVMTVLLDDSIEVTLQPLVDLGSATSVGFEALARLEDIPVDTDLAVNLSPAALFDDRVEALIQSYDGHRVVIELTEAQLASDLDDGRLDMAVAMVRQHGARIAIDDFGHGFSDLARLLRLRPDLIKIDRSVVRTLDLDPIRRAIIVAIAEVCHTLGASVVAEGIENPRGGVRAA